MSGFPLLPATHPTVSVIVVSFNTKIQLERCLAALKDVHQVIVIDNASTDGSADFLRNYPGITSILSSKNLGFGAANNLGLIQATGDLVLFLNSDAYAHEGAIMQLAKNFARPDVIAAGGKLLNVDGSLQESVAGRLTLGAVLLEQLFLDKLASRFGKSYWRTNRLNAMEASKVDQVMGACLMVRRDAEPDLTSDSFCTARTPSFATVSPERPDFVRSRGGVHS